MPPWRTHGATSMREYDRLRTSPSARPFSFEAALRLARQSQRNRKQVGARRRLRFGRRARDGGANGGNAARTAGEEDRLDIGWVQPRIGDAGGGRPKQSTCILFDYAIKIFACRVGPATVFS